MRNVNISLLILPLLLVSLSGVLLAQSGREEVCIVTLIGQNRNRTVAGAVNLSSLPVRGAPPGATQ